MAKSKKKKRKPARSIKSKLQKNNVSISEAIINISTSFIRHHGDSSVTLESLIPISIIAWNLSLFPDMTQKELYDKIVEQFPPELSAENIAVIIDTIEKIITEKKDAYPDTKRLIKNHSMSSSGGKLTLNIESYPIRSGKIK